MIPSPFGENEFGILNTKQERYDLYDYISEKISSVCKFKEDNYIEEKKEFYETLSRWKDSEIFHFLTKVMKTKSFFNRTKNYENKACAIYTLGLIGNKDAIPLLYKLKGSKNKLLKEYVNIAIRKIEHGQ